MGMAVRAAQAKARSDEINERIRFWLLALTTVALITLGLMDVGGIASLWWIAAIISAIATDRSL